MEKIRHSLKILLISLGCLFSSISIASDALVIGVSDYKVSPLKNPVNDAKLISDKLKSLGWRVTLIRNPNSRELKSSLKNFSKNLKKQNSNKTLIYFSGHGFQFFGENFLVPLNISDDSVIEDSLSISNIISVLDDFSNPKILIVDACRTSILDPETIPISVGLNSQPAPNNTLISYASAPGKVAFDGEGRFSPFAFSFSNALEDSYDISEVFLKTRINTMKITNGKQVPWETSSLVENITFDINPIQTQNNITGVLNPPTYDSLLVDPIEKIEFEENDIESFEDAVDFLILVAQKSNKDAFLNLYPNYEVSLNTERDRQDMIETFRKYKKKGFGEKVDRYDYFYIVSALQEGIANPDCRENGKLDENCGNADKVFTFKPNLETALKISELSNKNNINSSLLARHFRYGWVVNKDLVKAYDLYMKDKKQDGYYFLYDINVMIQEELVNLGLEIDIDGDFGTKSCLALNSVIGGSKCSNPPTRDEVKRLSESFYKFTKF